MWRRTEVIKTIPKKATAVAETSTIVNKGCYYMKFFTSLLRFNLWVYLKTWWFKGTSNASLPGPLKATVGLENHFRGAMHITTSFHRCQHRGAEGVEGEGIWHGDGCPLTIQLRDLGSIVNSRSGVSLAENGFYAYLRSERSLEHFSQYFEQWQGLPNVVGPWKPPISPLDVPVDYTTMWNINVSYYIQAYHYCIITVSCLRYVWPCFLSHHCCLYLPF